MVDRTTRIMNEFNKLKNSKCISIIKCEFMNGDINNWKVAFDGSPCSPYDHFYILLQKCFIQISDNRMALFH